MKKSKQLLGLRIVNTNSGKIIGKTCNVLFFPGQKKLLGFTVDCGKWIKKQKVLISKYIVNVGSDAVIVQMDDAIVDYEEYPELVEAIKERDRILGLNVMTDMGEELGFIDDVMIDENKLTIEGYVLSDGMIEDIIKGKTIIPFKEEMIFGEDTVIVSHDYMNVVLKNDISIKKVFQKGRRLRY